MRYRVGCCGWENILTLTISGCVVFVGGFEGRERRGEKKTKKMRRRTEEYVTVRVKSNWYSVSCFLKVATVGRVVSWSSSLTLFLPGYKRLTRLGLPLPLPYCVLASPSFLLQTFSRVTSPLVSWWLSGYGRRPEKKRQLREKKDPNLLCNWQQ